MLHIIINGAAVTLKSSSFKQLRSELFIPEAVIQDSSAQRKTEDNSLTAVSPIFQQRRTAESLDLYLPHMIE